MTERMIANDRTNQLRWRVCAGRCAVRARCSPDAPSARSTRGPRRAAPPAYKELTPAELQRHRRLEAGAAQRRRAARQMVGDFQRSRS